MKITDVSSSSTSETHNSDHENEKTSGGSDNLKRKKSLLQKFEIPVEQLDFGFVNKCVDPLKIERILRILRSGEEGIYPDLENCVVARLQELKPTSRLLRVETPALRTNELGSDQKKDIENGLAEWLSDVGSNTRRQDAETIFDTEAHDRFPLPVRGSSEQKVAELKSDKFTTIGKPNPNKDRIKSLEYDKWDKFDADAELTKLDIKDMQREEWEKREKPNVIAEQKHIKKLMKADGGGDCSGLFSPAPTATSNLPKPNPKRSACRNHNEKMKGLGKSYIEEVDNEDGVQVTVPNNSFMHPRRTKVVIEDLNLRM